MPLQRATFSLAGIANDGSGDLVITADMVVGTLGQPITARGKFQAGGAADEDEGAIFRVISDNYNGSADTPSDLRFLEVDDYYGRMRLFGITFEIFDQADQTKQLASQSANLTGADANWSLAVRYADFPRQQIAVAGGALHLGNALGGTYIDSLWCNLIYHAGVGVEAPGSDSVNLGVLLGGDGKLQLVARFPTGGAQALAIEP